MASAQVEDERSHPISVLRSRQVFADAPASDYCGDVYAS